MVQRRNALLSAAYQELLRGVDLVKREAAGPSLGQDGVEDLDHVGHGLRAVLLRIVVLLHAEDQGLLATTGGSVRSCSVRPLLEELRCHRSSSAEDLAHRFDAWPRLLRLFRSVHQGDSSGSNPGQARGGLLFDPDAWPFLEGGRPTEFPSSMTSSPPILSDAVVLRILELLVDLHGDAGTGRPVDVEQLGSIYESLLAVRVERASQTSIRVGKRQLLVGLDSLLARAGPDRPKLVEEQARVALTEAECKALGSAADVHELISALARHLSSTTPQLIPAGALTLQTTDQRRRSGSHYTSRELAGPIVRDTLRPILEALGPNPRPEQVLALKVCDPAMGTGAFLLEACRQLGHALVRAWNAHGHPEAASSDEDALRRAQRHVAQSCLYGVDTDPFAVELCKVSFWLATSAQDLPFTFLDHCLCQGDSLVGLSVEQICSVHWQPGRENEAIRERVDEVITTAAELRSSLSSLDGGAVSQRAQRTQQADRVLSGARRLADQIVQAFLTHEKDREREAGRRRVESNAASLLADPSNRPRGSEGLFWFHWPLEFPEVFAREGPGFDAVLGNPPFLNAIESRTARSASRADLYAHLYPTFAQGAYDASLLFWARATTLLLRPRGRYGMLSPLVLLSAERPWQAWMHRHWRPDAFRVYPVDQFEGASIRVAALIGGAGASPSCDVTITRDDGDVRQVVVPWSSAGEIWYGALVEPDAHRPDEKVAPMLRQLVLSKRFEIRAGCAAGVAYELKPLVQDATKTSAPEALRLITTGAIDRYRTTWGESTIRYLKHDYVHPRWPAGGQERNPASVVRARDAQRRPKLLVGGLTAVLEGWLDEHGTAAGVVSTWVITPKSCDERRSDGLTELKALTVIVNSASFSREFMRRHGGAALSGNQTTIKKSALLSMAIPDVFSMSAGFTAASFRRVLHHACPWLERDPEARSFMDQLALIHDAHASPLADERVDALGHFVVARMFGRTRQAALDDHAWWCARARRKEQTFAVDLAAMVDALSHDETPAAAADPNP